MKAFIVNIEGVVQGVGFRYFTQLKANELNVKGTVKNLSNGQVEIFVQADENLVLDFLEWCHKGPPSSTVLGLTYSEVTVRNNLPYFEIIR